MAKRKKKASNKPAKKKSRTKKAAPRSTPKAKSKASSRSKKPTRGGNSVDSLLKRFAKERVQKESQLESLNKKKSELETKTQKLQEQIGKLSSQVRETETQLSNMDQQRDQEVGELLAKLGIQLGKPVATSPPSSQTVREPHLDRMKSREPSIASNQNGHNS